MGKLFSAIVLIVVVVAAETEKAAAQRPFRGLFGRATASSSEASEPGYEEIEAAEPQPADPAPAPVRLLPQSPPHGGSVYDHYRAAWPKYFGGFHERHWSTYGRPHGDIGRGLRGSAW